MVREKYLPYVEPEREPEPPKTPKQLRKEKWDNFWFYHRNHVWFGIVCVFIALFIWRPWVHHVTPDYTIGFMTQYIWPDEYLEQMEKSLELYGEDLNNDGEVHVEIQSYMLNPPDAININVQEIQSSQTRFLGELAAGEIMVYIGDKTNIEKYGIGDAIFAKLKENYAPIKDGEEPKTEDVGILLNNCDAFGKNDFFSIFENPTLYLCIRSLSGTAAAHENKYREALKLFENMVENNPQDPSLLEALLQENKDFHASKSSAESSSVAK